MSDISENDNYCSDNNFIFSKKTDRSSNMDKNESTLEVKGPPVDDYQPPRILSPVLQPSKMMEIQLTGNHGSLDESDYIEKGLMDEFNMEDEFHTEDEFDTEDEYDMQDATGIWDEFGTDDEANYSFAVDYSVEDMGENNSSEDGVSIAADNGMENETHFENGSGTSYDANLVADDSMEDPAKNLKDDNSFAINNGMKYEDNLVAYDGVEDQPNNFQTGVSFAVDNCTENAANLETDDSMKNPPNNFQSGTSLVVDGGEENETNLETDDSMNDPPNNFQSGVRLAVDSGKENETNLEADDSMEEPPNKFQIEEAAYYLDGPSTDPETVDDLGLFQRPFSYITDNFNIEPEQLIQEITLERGSVYSTLSPFYKQNRSIRQAVVKFENEPGVGLGPIKEALRLFHKEEKDMLYEGYSEMIPRTYGEASKVLGRALYDTFEFTGGFPSCISKPLIFKLLTGKGITTYDEKCLIKSYINFSSMSSDDKLILLSAVNNGVKGMSSEKKSKFFEVISREKDIKIAQNIAPDYFNDSVDDTNWRQVVIDLAHLDINEKPACKCVAQEFQLCMGESGLYSINEAKAFINKMNPKPQSIIDMIETPLELTDNMKRVYGYLCRFITSHCDSPKVAEQFLMYFTASTNLPLTPITIDFNAEAVTAYTCADMIQLPTTYESYKDFEDEMLTLINDDAYIFTCA